MRYFFISDFDDTLTNDHSYKLEEQGAIVAANRNHAMQYMKPGLAELFSAIIAANGRLLVNTHAQNQQTVTGFLSAGLGKGEQAMTEVQARQFLADHVLLQTREQKQLREWQQVYEQQYRGCLLEHADDNGFDVMAFAKCVAVNEQLKLVVDDASELSDCICYFLDDNTNTRNYMQWAWDNKSLSHLSAFAQLHIIHVSPEPNYVAHLQAALAVVKPQPSPIANPYVDAEAEIDKQIQSLAQLPIRRLHTNALKILRHYTGASEYIAGRFFQRLREGRAQALHAEAITQVLAAQRIVPEYEMQQRAATVELLVRLDVTVISLDRISDPILLNFVHQLMPQVGLQDIAQVALLRHILRQPFTELQESICLRLRLLRESEQHKCARALKLLLGMPCNAEDTFQLEMISARCAQWLDGIDPDSEDGKLIHHYRQWFMQHELTPTLASMKEVVLALNRLRENSNLLAFPETLFAQVQQYVPMRLTRVHSPCS